MSVAALGSDLTARQADVHRFIYQSICERGIIPTVREIGLRFGIRSPNGVVVHLKSLIRKGYLEATDKHSRSYRPVKTPNGEEIKGWQPIMRSVET